MRGPLSSWFTEDHEWLDERLQHSVGDPGTFNRQTFEAFQAGLLHHSALEEELRLRAARRARSGASHPLARAHRIDAEPSLPCLSLRRMRGSPFGSVPSSSRTTRSRRSPGGLYGTCDELLAPETAEILEPIRAYPTVKMAPPRDGPGVYRTTEVALRSFAQQGERPSQEPTRR